jgi:hypothetical protein
MHMDTNTTSDAQTIQQLQRQIRNARARLRNAKGCDGKSEVTRQSLQSLIEHLTQALKMYRSFAK